MTKDDRPDKNAHEASAAVDAAGAPALNVALSDKGEPTATDFAFEIVMAVVIGEKPAPAPAGGAQ